MNTIDTPKPNGDPKAVKRKPHSEETKQRISEALRGRKLTAEHAAKISHNVRNRLSVHIPPDWVKIECEPTLRILLEAFQREGLKLEFTNKDMGRPYGLLGIRRILLASFPAFLEELKGQGTQLTPEARSELMHVLRRLDTANESILHGVSDIVDAQVFGTGIWAMVHQYIFGIDLTCHELSLIRSRSA